MIFELTTPLFIFTIPDILFSIATYSNEFDELFIVASLRFNVPLFVITLISSDVVIIPVPIILNVHPSFIVIVDVPFVIAAPFVSNVKFLSIIAFDVSVLYFNTIIVSPDTAPVIASSKVTYLLLPTC